MTCPYSPSGEKKVKCELYKSNSVDCNKVRWFENCGKFRILEGYQMPLDPYIYMTESGKWYLSYEEMKRKSPESVTDNEEPGNLHYEVL